MEINVTNEPRKPDLISKFTFILFGIFLTSMIFALLIKALTEAGIYISLILCTGLAIASLVYLKDRPRIRLIAYGMLTMVVISIIVLALSLTMLSGALQDL
jgi:hypothetical protein